MTPAAAFDKKVSVLNGRLIVNIKTVMKILPYLGVGSKKKVLDVAGKMIV